MRLNEFTLLVCMLFLCCVGSDALRKLSFLADHTIGNADKRSSNETELKAGYYSHCRRRSKDFEENGSIESDDKRVVPTGSNPLHNR